MIINNNSYKNKIISKIILSQYKYKLTKPYILSFTTLNYFISLRVKLILEGGAESEAEVVPLYGYSDESETDIIKYLRDAAEKITGCSLHDARNKVIPDIEKRPFSVTSILTAIDLFSCNIWKQDPPDKFVTPASTSELDELIKVADKLNDKKGTIKIKLSGDCKLDCASLGELNERNKWSDLQIRLDANQAYSLKDAISLFSYLNNLKMLKNISYVEQPLNMNNWDGNLELRKKFPYIDIMLDESIITCDDVRKAKLFNINFIKLKLFKQGGVKELIELSELANSLGIKVVLGNGVATWISNKTEIAVYNLYPDNYFGLLEANGFEKVSSEVSNNILFEIE